MLGRSLHPAAPRHQPSAVPHAAVSRLSQQCSLLQHTVSYGSVKRSSSSAQQPAQVPCAGLSAAPSRLGQQQQLHNSTHVVRVVALQQDDSFSVDKEQECFATGSSHELLDVVPEAGARVNAVCSPARPFQR
jgi:hypothetical protein